MKLTVEKRINGKNVLVGHIENVPTNIVDDLSKEAVKHHVKANAIIQARAKAKRLLAGKKLDGSVVHSVDWSDVLESVENYRHNEPGEKVKKQAVKTFDKVISGELDISESDYLDKLEAALKVAKAKKQAASK